MIAGDILGERARITPGRTALVYVPTGARYTYAELNARANRCARFWTERLGVKKGDRVAVLAHNCVEYLDAFFAAGKTGIIVVPLGTRLSAPELAQILEDCRPAALLYEPEFSSTVDVLKRSLALNCHVLDAVPGPPTPAFDSVACSPEDLWALLYTSGTTGQPKGVMVPHRMVLWNGYNTAANWGLREDDISPIFTPLYHAGGLGAFLLPIFTAGGAIVLHRGFDPAEIWRVLQEEKCTVVLGVPTIYKLLMDAPEFATADLRHVRWFISGGAPLPLYLIEAYQKRGVVFRQGYGLTEVGVNCFAMSNEDSARKLGSIGRPLMFTSARLVDAAGRDVAAGEVGELLLKGPHVCRGYWNKPEATAAALDRDGWFHTGDLARRDDEGFFYIAGRAKDLLISGGVNIYPAEIEAALLLHPAVQDAAVVGVAHATWGEVGVAFVVTRPGKSAAAEELSSFLMQRLARFKVPKEFILVDSLPRTAYGKVVKRELQEQYQRRRGASAHA